MILPLAKIAKRMINPAISKANIILTYQCNQRCQSCNIWKKYQDNPAKFKKEMNLSEFVKILAYNKFIWVSLTGGEPFLKEDIDDYLSSAMALSDIVSITTNGSMPEHIYDTVKRTLEKDTRSTLICNVSLEGNEKIHDTFTGKDKSFLKVSDTLLRLKGLVSRKFKLNIETMVSSKTDNHYTKLAAQYLKIPLTYTMEQCADYYDNQEMQIEKPKMPECKLTPSIMGINNYLFLKNSNGKSPDKPHCVAGQYSVSIDPYCRVYPCIMYVPSKTVWDMRIQGYKIGNINYKKLVESCSGCHTACEYSTMLMFRPWKAL